MQKLASDAIIHSHTACDIVNVTSDRIAEIRDLVNKCDLGGEKRVGGVFDQLGCLERRDHKRCFDQKKRTVELFHYLDCLVLIAADDDAVGAHKIIYCRALS